MSQNQNILIIDDKSSYGDFLAEGLIDINYDVKVVSILEEACSFISSKNFSVLLLAFNGRSNEDLKGLKWVKQKFPYIQVVVLAHQPNMKTAFHALRLGAFDFLSKSPNIEEFIPIIEAAYKKGKKEFEKAQTVSVSNENGYNSSIIGNTPQVKSIMSLMLKVAPTDSSVLILGETGAGKELAAQIIFQNSLRSNSPFIALNCGAIPDSLIESEIFGHEKGAFTDALSFKAGLFEEARGGTLFLDEVSEMSPSVQAKLLRVIETGRFRRLGSNKEVQVDARIISATNRDLQEEIRKKRFRADLYYRLAVVTIDIPPLRERREDIPLLAEYFLQILSHKIFRIDENKDRESRIKKISPSAMKFLVDYEWPGNIRELKNVIERLIVLSDGQTITPYDISQAIPGLYSSEYIIEEFTRDKIPSLEELERNHIWNVLKLTGGHRGKTSEILGISPRTLYTKLNQYKIDVKRLIQ